MPFIGSVEGAFGYGRPVQASQSTVEFTYSNFQNTTGLELVSVATPTTPNYWMYLTTAVGGDVGNVYRASTITYNRNFSFQWNFECSGGSTPPADGFCLQWTTTNNTNGAPGGGVGFLGASAYQGFTFLTYTNNILTWYKNGISQSNLSVASNTFRSNSYYWADYNHAASTMKIYYSTGTTKPATVNFSTVGFLFNATPYYIGFGAATGGATDNHILKSMTLTFT